MYGLIMFLEGTGLPGIPYEAFFLAAGVLIASGHLALVPLLILATVTNTAGTLVGYALGFWGGRPLLERYGPLNSFTFTWGGRPLTSLVHGF